MTWSTNVTLRTRDARKYNRQYHRGQFLAEAGMVVVQDLKHSVGRQRHQIVVSDQTRVR